MCDAELSNANIGSHCERCRTSEQLTYHYKPGGVPRTWHRHARPAATLGRYRRYDWPAVVAWLEEQRAGQWRKHRPSV
jgi:hypothetical protein